MLKRTPLFDTHVALGARMVEFGGWEMPVQYGGIMEEHRAVREQAGLFDICHMGRFMVRGEQAEEFLQYVLTCNVATIPFGQASYGLLCQPDGGIVDDVFIYHLLDEFLVVVNASNRDKDWAWLDQHSAGFDVEIEDRSERWAMLALQGPLAQDLLTHAPDSTLGDLAHLPFHGVAMTTVFGFTALIARTGYTGEDGFELFFDAHHAVEAWDALLALGGGGHVQPCGLGARDSLRFEACLPLYGHEISATINPYEARLGWVVKLDKGAFVGHEALAAVRAQGPARRITGFELLGRGVARGDYPVHNLQGEPIGHVTTGMPSPTLGQPLGIALVPSGLSSEGSEFAVIVRGQPVRARAVKMPFYKPRYKKL
ncbi:MAG: glycine cleavage system aminomethyltransferase GcvT [Candidatus Viridilinea halotolerans]|uniref:Aminomethyltransferase n=1 Tax=Candidatus Viridilinea halotolerans TaxID=2491704 RepID=A0A426TQW6_9CHLR|nr:MAG: glycine cleavage system aminomethyltransferase GcvT [Candidatus Viridilinea halotolerans]